MKLWVGDEENLCLGVLWLCLVYIFLFLSGFDLKGGGRVVLVNQK